MLDPNITFSHQILYRLRTKKINIVHFWYKILLLDRGFFGASSYLNWCWMILFWFGIFGAGSNIFGANCPLSIFLVLDHAQITISHLLYTFSHYFFAPFLYVFALNCQAKVKSRKSQKSKKKSRERERLDLAYSIFNSPPTTHPP